MDSKADLGKQKKETSSLKAEQGKLSSLRKRKKTDRRKHSKVPTGHKPVYQHLHCESPRRKE